MPKSNIPGMEYWDKYTQQQLHDAFDLVKNKENWKLAIDATIPATSNLTLISDAVIYFTGSVPEITALDENTVQVTAVGYYVAIGS